MSDKRTSTSYSNSMYNQEMQHLDYLYGPWESIEQMYEDLQVSLEEIPEGLTIGIIEGDEVVEYWNPTKEIGFIKKLSSGIDEIIVTGVTVGNYKSGDVIEKGTAIEDVLKKIFMKELYPDDKSPKKPSIVLNGVTTGTFEVGTSINTTFSISYTDGQIATFSNARDLSSTYVNAGCEKQDNVKYLVQKPGGSYIELTNLTNEVLVEGTYNFKSTVGYSANTVVPKTNFGNPANDAKYNISAGTAESPVKSVVSKYKIWYIKTTDADKSLVVEKGNNVNNISSYGSGTWFNGLNQNLYTTVTLGDNERIYVIVPSECKVMFDTLTAKNTEAVEGEASPCACRDPM